MPARAMGEGMLCRSALQLGCGCCAREKAAQPGASGALWAAWRMRTQSCRPCHLVSCGPQISGRHGWQMRGAGKEGPSTTPHTSRWLAARVAGGDEGWGSFNALAQWQRPRLQMRAKRLPAAQMEENCSAAVSVVPNQDTYTTGLSAMAAGAHACGPSGGGSAAGRAPLTGQPRGAGAAAPSNGAPGCAPAGILGSMAMAAMLSSCCCWACSSATSEAASGGRRSSWGSCCPPACICCKKAAAASAPRAACQSMAAACWSQPACWPHCVPPPPAP